MLRKIIHCDCDCFYAAVEMRDDPRLRSVPLAVGGVGGRGVVATCNYLARDYGVRSAMPVSEARRLCPELLVVPPDMARYRRVSEQVMGIFREYTDLVEPLSLDEAFLDVTESSGCQGSATLMAREIRRRVREEVGIVVSAGVAPNKFVAKVASDWRKPDGLFVVTPEALDDFVRDLPVQRLFGVGEVTAAKLAGMGVRTCGDLRAWPVFRLREKFGRQGQRLSEMAHGVDERPVVTERVRKSVSVERTYETNLITLEACQEALEVLWKDLEKRLDKSAGQFLLHKLFFKIRYADFTTRTHERVLGPGEAPAPGLYRPLLETLFEDPAARSRGVRLMGIGVRFRDSSAPRQQLCLFS